ncbi:MAG: DNA primase [Thermodesulforhabdaceae bacterium]
MTGARNGQLIEKIKEVADILDIVGEAVNLRRAGRYYVGLCPFHAEKTPSFYVDHQRQIFHCFGCGAGGDVIKFVMQHRGLSFPEAIEFLADRYNIRIETSRPGTEANRTSLLLQYIAVAEEFYYQQLRYSSEGSVAREYLKKRQIDERIVEEQRLGYAPQSWDALVRHFKNKGLDLQKGVELGLFAVASNRSGEKFYDRFRNRLIFPIRNHRGKVIAFGGRTLAEGDSSNEPKYLNSPESEIYRKRSTLYQFHLAQEACRKEKRQIILVEGYMDALAFHRVGFYRAVATLGTALTPQQARLIKRIADEVLLVYDGDEAGIKAMIRNFPVLAQEGLQAFCVVLPDGMDPDDFFRNHSLTDFENLMNSKMDLGEFAIDEILKSWDGSTNGKMKVLSDLFNYLEAISHPVMQAEYIKMAGIKLGLSDEVINKQFKLWSKSSKSPMPGEFPSINYSGKVDLIKAKSHFVQHSNAANSSKKYSPRETYMDTSPPSLEEEILKILVTYPHTVEVIAHKNCWEYLLGNDVEAYDRCNPGQELTRLIFKGFYEEWLEISSNEWNKNKFCIDQIYDRVQDPKARNLLSKIIFESKLDIGESTARLFLNDYLGALEKQFLKERRNYLVRKLAEAEKKGDVESIKDTLRKIQCLMEVKNHNRHKTFGNSERGTVKDDGHNFYKKP